MILLTTTSDVVNLVTSAATVVEVHTSYVDINGATVTPGRKNTSIAAATTTAIVAAPAASTARTVKTVQIRNIDATASQVIDVQHTDGTTVVCIFRANLAPGWSAHYDYGAGWTLRSQAGLLLPPGFTPPSENLWQSTVLSADVANNNLTANTIADVTGLSFPVNSGKLYFFSFSIWYTAASTTNGSRWSINGPANNLLAYRSEYSLAATTRTTNSAVAYDIPTSSNASSGSTTGNVALIDGFVRPTANGTIIARFASEVSNGAIVAKQGSNVRWIAVV